MVIDKIHSIKKITTTSNVILDNSNFLFFKRVTIAKYIIHGFLIIGALLLPWYRFVKVRTYETVVIDAGVWDLADWTSCFLILMLIFNISYYIIFYRYRGLTEPIKDKLISYTRKTDFIMLILTVPIFFTLADPIFLPGLGDRHIDYITILQLNWLGYTIDPLPGLIGIIILLITTPVGLFFSIFYPD